MTEGSAVTHLVPIAEWRRVLACTLGGDNAEYLYIGTVPDLEGAAAGSVGQGRLERVLLDGC